MKKEKEDKRGIIITFSIKSGKACNSSEKTKFFKQLYGWTQTIPGKKKEYEYHREGILDKVPHKRVDQSAFIVPEDDFDKVMEFFEQWQKKVITNVFKVILEDDIFSEFERMSREMEEEEKIEEEQEGLSDEEEKNIIKRHKEWQKRKMKQG